MHKKIRTSLLLFSALLLPLAAHSQAINEQSSPQTGIQPGARMKDAAEDPAPQLISVPSGTKVLLILKNTVSSRNAKPGDGVFLESTFPVVEQGKVVIPAGTYVQGVVDSVKRSGRVKGRAELLLHFTTLIYPNGYTVSMPGALESSDSADSQKVKDKEGTVQANGNKGRDAGAIATSAGTGALIGGLSRGLKGGLIGGGIGAAVGVATAMLTRGDEVRIESGTSVEMVLQRPLDLDLNRIDPNSRNIAPTPQRYRKLDKPTSFTSTIPTVGLPRVP